MKLIQLIAILALCSYRVSAETTVEMIQQRAAGGDVTAQTLLGFMTYSGSLLSGLKPLKTKLMVDVGLRGFMRMPGQSL